MPKETIHAASDDQFQATVGWTRDQKVTLATIVEPREHNAYALVKEMEAEGLAFYGFPVDLDRAGINRLIRALRTARDQAFGRDE